MKKVILGSILMAFIIILSFGCNRDINVLVDSDDILSGTEILYVDSIADLKENDFFEGDIFRTLGYYEIADKGGATYQVVDDPALEVDGAFVHALNNGLKASLVVEKETVNVRQLGAKADYGEWMGDSDNYAAFMAAFKSEVPLIDLVGGTYFIGAGKRLTVNREIVIDGNGATLISDSGIVFDVNINEKASASDFDITSDSDALPRKGIGIEVVNQIDSPVWGGSVDFQNVKTFHYQIGFKGDMLYNTELNRIHSASNDIGFYFASSNNFSNVNAGYSLSAIDNTYGIVMENFRNAVFFNSVIESDEYGIIVDGNSEYVSFQNTWFELMGSAPVTFGAIDWERLELIPSEKTNNKIQFTNNRWSQVETDADVFYSPGTTFSSRYKQVDGPNYDFEELMSGGIEYVNYAEDDFTVLYQTGGEVSYEREMTPFGEKRVTKIIGADEKDLFVSFPFTTYKPGHYYLVKFKIRLNQAAVIRALMPSEPAAEENTSDDTWVEANAWTDVSTILQMKDSFSDPESITIDEGGSIGFAVYERDDGLDLEAMEPAVYDLTEIFGSGNEPDVQLNTELSKYFTYVDYLHTGKTGNFSGDYSEKERIEVSLQNGWTGEASYRYLGNGLTEIAGVSLGTGTISAGGTELFKIPSEYAPGSTSIQLAVGEGTDPAGMMWVQVNSDGKVSIAGMDGYTVSENDPNASVQFNFIISSDGR